MSVYVLVAILKKRLSGKSLHNSTDTEFDRVREGPRFYGYSLRPITLLIMTVSHNLLNLVRRDKAPFLSGWRIPPRQLSLQPVAVGATMEVTTSAEALRRQRAALGRFSDHVGRNAIERRAGLETGNAEADPPGLRGRLQAVEKRATRAPTGSAGVTGGGTCGGGGWNATREALPAAWHTPTDNPRGPGRTEAGWRRGPQYRGSRVTPVEGRSLGSRAADDGGRDVGTGVSLSASERVQRLQTALHAKAKEAPGFRFYSLCDKVWRDRRARGRLAGCASQRRARPGWTARRSRTSSRSEWTGGWEHWRGT